MKVRRKEPIREYICWQGHGDHPAVRRAKNPQEEDFILQHRHKDGRPGHPDTHGLLHTIARHDLVIGPGYHILSVPPEHNGGVVGYYAHPDHVNFNEVYDIVEP